MESINERPTWKRRLLIGVVDLVTLAVTLVACFLVFIMGAFASDSGTHTALLISFSLIGVSGLYALATVVAVVASQVRNSFKLAAAPIVLPILFIIWVVVA